MAIDGRTNIPIEALKARADLLITIRQFMADREILEVETPYLSHASNSDPNLVNLATEYSPPNQLQAQTLYLHSSPEYPMKRLLASASSCIYQIARVFRDEEQGAQHNPEFTMLEWYRLGFDHHQLMDELEQLLLSLKLPEAERISYEDAFIRFTELNPHTSSDTVLQAYAKKEGFVSEKCDRAMLLDFIFSNKVSPGLGFDSPCYIFDYPVSQAALAKIKEENGIMIAERFELFISGMEIANGYNELTDADELRQRFEREQLLTGKKSISSGPIDEHLLASMRYLPECAGVALGIDRLLMILLGKKDIKDVINFCVDKA